MLSPTEKQVLQLARKQKVLRPKDLECLGLPPSYLWRLAESGQLLKLGRGVYAHPLALEHEHLTLLEVAKRVPKGIFCLLTALNFHQLGDQQSPEVWVALPPGAHHVHFEGVRVRYVHFSGLALTCGVEKHKIGQYPIHIYSSAKTVADCFKFRHKIGLDIALEALKAVQGKVNADELWQAAKVNRVQKVMRPYLEALAL